MPTKHFKLYATLLLAVILLSWAVYWAFFEREHHHWTDKVQLLNGNTITVTHHASERTYHGHPHAFGWGGGDPHHEMRFILSSDRTVTWEGKFIPIVLELQDQVPYLIVFDRETDFRKARFRYYRFHNDWEEIPPTHFPKSLARQNMWLTEAREIEALRRMDPTDINLQSSLTAAIWLQLENGIEYFKKKEASEEFLRNYIHNYMKTSNNPIELTNSSGR